MKTSREESCDNIDQDEFLKTVRWACDVIGETNYDEDDMELVKHILRSCGSYLNHKGYASKINVWKASLFDLGGC